MTFEVQNKVSVCFVVVVFNWSYKKVNWSVLSPRSLTAVSFNPCFLLIISVIHGEILLLKLNVKK